MDNVNHGARLDITGKKVKRNHVMHDDDIVIVIRIIIWKTTTTHKRKQSNLWRDDNGINIDLEPDVE